MTPLQKTTTFYNSQAGGFYYLVTCFHLCKLAESMNKGDKGCASALYVWNGMSLFWGTSFHTNPHLHETLQLVFDIDKNFFVKDEQTEWTAYSAAIIRASHMHQLDSNNSIQLFIYLDKDSEYAQKLTEKYLNGVEIGSLERSDVRKLSSNFFKKLLVLNNCKSLYQGCVTIFQHLLVIEKPKNIDARIEKAIAFIAQTNHPMRVGMVAEHVCLSESRLRHLFKKEVGQPIQNFMLWMKVVDSLNMVLKGKQATEAAYEAGFWDSSHMNRSFKELIGVAPGAIKKYEKDLKIVSCANSNFYTFKTEVWNDWKKNERLKTIQT